MKIRWFTNPLRYLKLYHSTKLHTHRHPFPQSVSFYRVTITHLQWILPIELTKLMFQKCLLIPQAIWGMELITIGAIIPYLALETLVALLCAYYSSFQKPWPMSIIWTLKESTYWNLQFFNALHVWHKLWRACVVLFNHLYWIIVPNRPWPF